MARKVLLALLCLVYRQCEATCPSGFSGPGGTGCYFVGTSSNSFAQATDICRRLGGYLTNIDDSEENDSIVRLIKDTNKIFQGYWIGGLYDGKDWVWQKPSNGAMISDKMADRSYSNWGPGQPLDGMNADYALNVAIMTRGIPVPYAWYSKNGYTWNTVKMSYICEADQKP